MRKPWLCALALLALTLLGGLAHAGSGPTTQEGLLPAPSAAGPGELPLIMSIRALSLGQTLFPAPAEMERVKAPTGAGTSRWPTGEVGRGVYISVMPACIPGVDEPLRRAGSARRR